MTRYFAISSEGLTPTVPTPDSTEILVPTRLITLLQTFSAEEMEDAYRFIHDKFGDALLCDIGTPVSEDVYESSDLTTDFTSLLSHIGGALDANR